MSLHVALIALTSLSFAAPAEESRPQTDVDPESSEAIAEILASDVLVQEEDGSPSEDGRWILRDLLDHDFAECRTLERNVADVVRDDSLQFLRSEPWLERLEREALVARLRLVPMHQAVDVTRRIAFDIPIADHPLVDLYIDYFTGRGRWFFERWLERHDKYVPLMQPILAKYGLPRDLVYVAMIESGFAAQATSWARAAGFWQFIGSTGKIYGLRNDVWIDERRDFIRATEAAAKYLGYLYQDFGDWHLAWAGYNAGEGRIRRAIQKAGGARDFWTISSQRGVLAKETQHYVPKIIAAAIIAKDRTRYGFPPPIAQAPMTYDEITVDDATELGAVARKFGFELATLRELNPALIYGVTPPGGKAKVRVPEGHGEEVTAWLSGLPREQRLSYASHKIAAGDNLSRIAQLTGSSVEAIREFNHITNVKRLRLGQTLIIPVSLSARRTRPDSGATLASVARPAAAAAPAPATPSAAPRPAAVKPALAEAKPSPAAPAAAGTAKGELRRHKVAQGETLWSIAQRYKVSVAQVRSWNALHGDRVRAGDVLQIYAAAPHT